MRGVKVEKSEFTIGFEFDLNDGSLKELLEKLDKIGKSIFTSLKNYATNLSLGTEAVAAELENKAQQKLRFPSNNVGVDKFPDRIDPIEFLEANKKLSHY